MNDTEAYCKCKTGYHGLNCELMLDSLKIQKSIVTFATILAFILIHIFCILTFHLSIHMLFYYFLLSLIFTLKI